MVISDIPRGDYLMYDVFYELNERERILRRKVVTNSWNLMHPCTRSV